MSLIPVEYQRPLPIVPEELYSAFLRVNPEYEKAKPQILDLGNKLIADGGSLLSQIPNAENLIAWVKAQRHTNNVNEQRRKIESLRRAVDPSGIDDRSSQEKIADFCTSFLEIKGIAPLVIQRLEIREKVIKSNPQTVWEVLCSCPQMFV